MINAHTRLYIEVVVFSDSAIARIKVSCIYPSEIINELRRGRAVASLAECPSSLSDIDAIIYQEQHSASIRPTPLWG